MPPTPTQLAWRGRIEAVLRIAAPALDLVLAAGDRAQPRRRARRDRAARRRARRSIRASSAPWGPGDDRADRHRDRTAEPVEETLAWEREQGPRAAIAAAVAAIATLVGGIVSSSALQRPAARAARHARCRTRAQPRRRHAPQPAHAAARVHPQQGRHADPRRDHPRDRLLRADPGARLPLPRHEGPPARAAARDADPRADRPGAARRGGDRLPDRAHAEGRATSSTAPTTRARGRRRHERRRAARRADPAACPAPSASPSPRAARRSTRCAPACSRASWACWGSSAAPRSSCCRRTRSCVFWLLALAVLFAHRWPQGMPPAWETGTAVPWPSAAEVAERRARGARRGAKTRAEPEPRARSGSDIRTSKKRKPTSQETQTQALAH